MAEAIQAGKDASAETQEILKELQKEGHDIPGMDPPAPTEAETKAKAEAAAKEKSDADAKAAADLAAAEKKAKEEPEAEKNEDGTPKKPVQRSTKLVPVEKHNEERHKRQEAERLLAEEKTARQELQKKIDAFQTTPTEGNLDEIRADAIKVAEKHGMDEEFLADFAEMIAKRALQGKSTLPKDIEQQLANFNKLAAEQETLKKNNEEMAKQQAEEQGFEKEFADVVKEKPDLAEHKDRLKELAFAEGNEQTSLRRIALEFINDELKPGRKSAEHPIQGKKGEGNVVDYAQMTEEQVQQMDGPEFDKYMEWVAANSKKLPK